MRRLAAVLACSLALTGCEITETLEIRDDGTGTYGVELILERDDPTFYPLSVIEWDTVVEEHLTDNPEPDEVRALFVELYALNGDEPFLDELAEGFELDIDGDRFTFRFEMAVETFRQDGETGWDEWSSVFSGLQLTQDGGSGSLRADGRDAVEELLRDYYALDGSPFDVARTSEDSTPLVTWRARIGVDGDVTSSDSHRTVDGFHVWEWSLGGEDRPGIELSWTERSEGLVRPEVIALGFLVLAVLGAIAAILVYGLGIRPSRRSTGPRS